MSSEFNLKSYEQHLEELRAVYTQRKKEYDDMWSEYNYIDQGILKNLFSLAEETLYDKNLNPKSVFFTNIRCEDYNDSKRDVARSYNSFHDSDSGILIDKRHCCTKPGCTKSYTSNHGLKYHMLHGHKSDSETVIKPYGCPIPSCSKTYRNTNGLKYHLNKAHPEYQN